MGIVERRTLRPLPHREREYDILKERWRAAHDTTGSRGKAQESGSGDPDRRTDSPPGPEKAHLQIKKGDPVI